MSLVVRLFDHLVGALRHAVRDGDAQLPGGFAVADETESVNLLDRQITGNGTCENSLNVPG